MPSHVLRQRKHLRAVLDSVYDGVFIHDLHGNVLDANDKALAMYGVDRNEITNLNIIEHVSSPDNPVEELPKVWSRVISGEPQLFEWIACKPDDGTCFPVEVYLRRIELGEQSFILATVRNIAERKKTENRLKLYEQLFEHALEGISITDPEGTIVSVNPAFTRITGYTAEEAVGQNPRILKSDRHDKAFYERMWKELKERGQWEGEIWNRKKSGQPYPEWLSISAIRDGDGTVTHYAAVFHDISESKMQQERIEHQAYHDALTDLPNRHLLLDRLSLAIAKTERSETQLAVFFLDLDHFKDINDSMGHLAGDTLLQQVAGRLRERLRKGDTVSRHGGDEFIILAEGVTGEELDALIRRIMEAFEAPFTVNGKELQVTVSMGITLFPSDGEDAESLIRNADMAMYRAKGEGRNTFHFFTSSLESQILKRIALEKNLREGLSRREFLLHYQPKVDLRTGRVIGAEGLVRWKSNREGMVSPQTFIPLAEETGLILPLSDQILDLACSTGRKLDSRGHQITIAVNISARQFIRQDFPAKIVELIEGYGLPAERIELEITETAIMDNFDRAVATAQELIKTGFRIVIDDFGSGYSSLGYLKDLPVSALKIDRTFIQGLPGETSDKGLVNTIVELGRNLGLEVVAEGVERLDQALFLKKIGCHIIQGYYYSRPLPENAFLKYLDQNRR